MLRNRLTGERAFLGPGGAEEPFRWFKKIHFIQTDILQLYCVSKGVRGKQTPADKKTKKQKIQKR